MRILGIETSCDETGAAILEEKGNSFKILSNVVASSVKIHAKTGGIIPENAAREQLSYILPVIKRALSDANIKNPQNELDGIAVTVGPGLIGSLLVGVETARTLSYVWQIPIISVNHLYGHIYANFIEQTEKIEYPAICLVVSGGHTDLVLMKNKSTLDWLGGTRDDAAGECLDKAGRLLNLPYPAGPIIEELAKKGDSKRFNFPSPLLDSPDFDFSFSGLKAAVLREVKNIEKLDDSTVNDICASVQKAVVSVLVRKTLKAAEKFNARSILLGGGVAANSTLRQEFELSKKDMKFFVPPKNLCTDNAAMIAAAGTLNKPSSWNNLDASPSLHF